VRLTESMPEELPNMKPNPDVKLGTTVIPDPKAANADLDAAMQKIIEGFEDAISGVVRDEGLDDGEKLKQIRALLDKRRDALDDMAPEGSDAALAAVTESRDRQSRRMEKNRWAREFEEMWAGLDTRKKSRPLIESGSAGRLIRTQLLEEVVRSKPASVEAQTGIIRGVKILGLESVNGRRYSPTALKGAVRMYEGRAVNVDHPNKPGDRRSSYDRFGKLSGVHFREGQGLYGDLHYLKTHPLAGPVAEAAKRMPDLFGLSHNAQGDGRSGTDGVFVVESLTAVRSVDVVADPATTRGLYESRR